MLASFDIFKPYYYRLEKKVASKAIPAVHERLRHRLSDYDATNTLPEQRHALWTALLQDYVDASGATINKVTGVTTVDYTGLGADDRFATYVQQLSATDVNSLTLPEQLAFWINAYNAYCINMIVSYEKQHAPQLTSITELTNVHPTQTSVWDQVCGNVNGQDVTLGRMEHEFLRGTWQDVEIHACIVCASASCPNLRMEAYEARQLRSQMKSQMQSWLANPTKGSALLPNKRRFFFGRSNTLYWSRIFLWFQDDFGGNEAGVRAIVAKFTDGRHPHDVLQKATIRYFAYDWSMNRKA